MRFILIGASALLAAGCAEEATVQNEAPPAPAAELDDRQRQVQGMAAEERNAMLLKAVKEAGHPCEAVTESQEEVAAKLPVYSATCSNNAVYMIAVGGEGKLKAIPMLPAEER